MGKVGFKASYSNTKKRKTKKLRPPIRFLEKAVSVTEKMGIPLEQAHAHYELAVIYDVVKDRSKMKEHVKKAKQLFRRCGARIWLDRIEDQFDALLTILL